MKAEWYHFCLEAKYLVAEEQCPLRFIILHSWPAIASPRWIALPAYRLEEGLRRAVHLPVPESTTVSHRNQCPLFPTEALHDSIYVDLYPMAVSTLVPVVVLYRVYQIRLVCDW